MKFPLNHNERSPQPLQRQSAYFPQNQSLAGSLQLVPGGNIRIGQSNYNVGTGLWAGLVDGVPKLSLGVSSGDHLTWDGDSLDITGGLTATTGTIGGFTLGATTLTATNLILDSSGQRITLGTTNDIVILDADDATYRLWIGNATAGSAPFRVTSGGAVTATDITITGGSVLSSLLSGLVSLSNQNIATQGWTQTCAFSITDADTVAWAAGTFTTAGGTSYSIGAGNTGNMAAKTYIYLDIGVSTTAYQTTTTATTAVGSGKVLVAVAQNGTVEPTFTVLDGTAQNINASSIVADSITGNEIAASTIEAGHLSVSTLSAITADMGTLTAGTIALASSGHIRAGQTAYATGTGFFLGFDASTPKFSIGGSTSFFRWDGTNLRLEGDIFAVNTLKIDCENLFHLIANPAWLEVSKLLVGGGDSTSHSFTGGAAPRLQVRGTVDSWDGGAALLRFSGNGGSSANVGSFLWNGFSRGTPSTETIVQNGDIVGGISWEVDCGLAGNARFKGAAQIRVVVDGTPGSADTPGYISLMTTADGSSTPSESVRISNGGATTFPRIGTTASAANAFLDSGSTPANSLLRSTSSLKYKLEVEDILPEYYRKVLDLRPIWYRSAAKADNPEWSYYGLAAEEVAAVDPRLANFGYQDTDWLPVEDEANGITHKLRDGAVKVPDGVAYERLAVLLIPIVKQLEKRITTLEVN